MLIIFASRTGNVKRFVNKALASSMYKLEAHELPDIPQFKQAHLVTYTDPRGEIPPLVDSFLQQHHQNILSVSGSGNRNWGRNFAAAVDKINQQYGIPINIKFEISGNNDELQQFIHYINNPVNMETKINVIKFQTDNCVTCGTVAKAMDNYGIPYRDINPFDHPEMAAKYRVRSVPTVVATDGENELLRMVGYKPEAIEKLHQLVTEF